MVFKASIESSEKSIKEIVALAEKKKLDLENFPLSEVTGQYLNYIKKEKAETEEITEFLVLASRLLSLKVKALMPEWRFDSLEEEEEDISEQLARHLLEYRTFKEAAGLFKERFEDKEKKYVRHGDFNNYVYSVSSSASLQGLGLSDLVNALEKLLQRETTAKTVHALELSRQEYKVADKIKEVSFLVTETGNSGIEFQELFAGNAQKAEIIATFLALLELVRLNKVKIIQEGNFGRIVIYGNERPSLSQGGSNV